MINSKFKFQELTLEELKTIYKSIKKKSDCNKVSSEMIINRWHIVGRIILRIVTKSLQKVFPENWKTAIITPIEKIAKTKRKIG